MAIETKFSEWGSWVVSVGATDCMHQIVRDRPFLEEVLSLLVRSLGEERFQAELSSAVVTILKLGIRESLDDDELKDVTVSAIREALSDERLMGMLRNTLKDALKDRELHEATLNGAMDALKESLDPFRRMQHLHLTGGRGQAPAA